MLCDKERWGRWPTKTPPGYHGKGLSQEPQTITILVFCDLICRHGEGLSREPYCDFFIVLDLFSWLFIFWTLFDCDSGHDGHFGELPLFEYDIGSFVSSPICMLKDPVPDGSLKRSSFV